MVGGINRAVTSTRGNGSRTFREVYAKNIWITTSAVWDISPMGTILANTAIDRILYSVDYPFTNYEAGTKWFADLKVSGMVSERELEAIAYENAMKLFGWKAE